MKARWYALLLGMACAPLILADGPADNLADKVRPVPPPGVAIPATDRAELQAGSEALGKEIEILRQTLKTSSAKDLLPDVQIYHNAVRYALQHNEFYDVKEIPVARTLLAQGMARAAQLKAGKPTWTTATGLVVRGYVSRIDGSVQPYGLVVPPSYAPTTPHAFRLDCWFHGRGEKLTELSFLDGRQKSPGEFTPAHTFVLHPYGRYCNANKFAGEIDLFEALDHVKKHYPIDENRIAVRGFSMGGAACWQFAVHYPGLWAAAAPGAGFSETPEFLKVFQKEDVQPTDYEKSLWHLYDCPDYASNLFNLPTVAYSGEIDNQKQAADMMVTAMKKANMDLVHIIGPKTGHRYHPQSKEEINRRLDAIMARGRNPVPPQIWFTTWTLRYNSCNWLKLERLERHWEQASVRGDIVPPYNPYTSVRPMGLGASRSRAFLANLTLATKNVQALTLNFEPGTCPFAPNRSPMVVFAEYGAREPTSGELPFVLGPPVRSDRSWTAHFRKVDGKWQNVPTLEGGGLAKRPGLQGPIDDAFMDSFLMVRPTGKALNDRVGAWTKSEMEHAVDHWRKQFRGEARVKEDKAVTDEDIANHNLVLWGDPSSNQILAKIAAKLPVLWDAQGVHLGKWDYPAESHVPVLIYPNPLNPNRYIVVNSGFTFREYDYLNNARQVPKLPDYAVLDVRSPRTSRAPAKVVTAGFFDEAWRVVEGLQ